MIKINNLCKKYGEHIIFNDFTMSISDGELIAITGKSGCGKTTLLNMIGAIEPFDSGNIYVNEYNLSEKKCLLEYYRRETGFLFQNFGLIDNKTVKENLEIIKPRYRNDISVEKALDRMGLLTKMNEKVYKLSGGEQQRIAIARLLLKKSSIILADEPTGSLDRQNGDEVFNILKEINRSMNETVIIVTHDIRLADKCDRKVDLGGNDGE